MKLKTENFLKAWMKYTANLESPTSYREWVGISLLASILQRRVGLMWDRKIFPNFYIFLVGPPGAKKGTALNPARALLESMEIQMAPAALTRRRFLTILQNSGLKTPKNFSSYLNPVSALTIHSSELTVFINKRELQLITDLVDLYDYDGDAWKYETEHSGSAEIPRPFVNLIGGTQPGMLTQMLPEEAVAVGFMSRVVAVYEDRKGKVVTFPQDLKPKQSLHEDILHDLQEIGKLQGWFSIDNSFRESYEEWYENYEKEFNVMEDRLLHYVQRRPTHLLKLCMVMNISRNGNLEITAEDFQAAHELLTRTEKRMNRTFAGMGRAEHAEASNAILRHIFLEGEVQYSVLLKRFFRDADETTISKIIAAGEKFGDIAIKPLVTVNGTHPTDFIIQSTSKEQI